jgi:methylene-fatty-acyl-phospholipid synthase
MLLWTLLICAALLSIERLSYYWIWHNPEAFQSLCDRPAIAVFGEPIDILQKLFYIFKAIQLSVFVGWCVVFADGTLPLPSGGLLSTTAGGILMMIGQTLNLSVFYRLGKPGVFYGNKLGYEIPWCYGFPFTVCRHPQYLGTLISIWGFFLVMRFPNSDWIMLPAIQTVYYALGAYFES